MLPCCIVLAGLVTDIVSLKNIASATRSSTNFRRLNKTTTPATEEGVNVRVALMLRQFSNLRGRSLVVKPSDP